MKHLIKSLMTIFVVVSITLCGIAFNYATAQEVGEKMPSLEGYVTIDYGQWSNPDMTKNGTSEWMAKSEAEGDNYFVVYNKCDGVTAELPFGIYNIETNILYLDNAPTDGIIDAVVPDPTSFIYEDAPDCKGEISEVPTK